ncbi:37S ribosomal protein S10, mitochondrial [Leucoagaricus sp. SymC.cos]|nr:37S ribosomal protein S10, mitochondrial [Leucoagaricus sp. SymC.cos]
MRLTSFGSKEAEIAARVVPGRALQEPHYHARTHDIPVASIHFRSHHVKLLDLFTHFATHAASSFGIPCSRVIHLPTQRRLWTVLRSPFAHKKSQENFERKVHKRAIKAWDAHPEVVEQWVKYLRVHAMGGVGFKVTRWEHLPLGVGEKRYKDVVLELEASPADQIKELGEKILAEELGSAPAPAPEKPADT